MLKLNASFSKKVPGSQQYSSEGFMASVEVEIPDGLNEQQLKYLTDLLRESQRVRFPPLPMPLGPTVIVQGLYGAHF